MDYNSSSYLENSFCQNECGHGVCIENVCQCLPYWNGDQCDVPFKFILGKLFNAWKIGFIIIFSGLIVLLFYKIILYLLHQKLKKKQVKFLKISTYCLLVLSAISRLLYLSSDPMKQTGRVNGVFVELAGGLGLYFLFSAFLLILLYWAGLYHRVFGLARIGLFNPIAKNLFLVIDAIWLIFEIIVRVLYGLENKSFYTDGNFKLLDLIYSIYTMVIGISFSLGFMIYGTLIYHEIKKVQIKKESKENVVKKLTFIVTILSWTFLIGVVSLILIIKFNVVNHPYGALGGLTLQFIVEIALNIELLYILHKKTDKCSVKKCCDQKE
ncbi:hypothetical protein CYY_003646 [Polysphondylium violaceum]|uniref:THH1/TOM1/TOM3 domain-containing protein n=1 Tax=Polysphondylium violaceum TaxID=133409 RepID=A0A8J4PWN3_9MYCE|nr:hypothetical protein CYY_003646 [Polysphondylium violaceum]